MVSKKKARPSRRQRLASKPVSSASTRPLRRDRDRKDAILPLPGEPTRFFDRFSRREAQAALALALLVAICYLPAMLWGGLTWDDHAWSQSRAVREWSGLGALWSFPPRIEREVHYWPLTYTTFWLEHKIWGLEPFGYHVVNVLLHLFNTLLVWRLLLRLAVPGAWIAAAVFAVHPTHVESVAWIIERKDVLSGLFYLAAVLVWLRFLEKPRPWRYGLALVLFAAGLLSKSIVVTLPAALLIVQWWKEGRVTVRDLKRVAPFFLVALIHTAVDLASTVERSVMVSRVGLLDYSLPERMLVASQALWFYAGKLVWPTDLAVIYPRWDISLGDPWAWLYLVAAAALAATLWFLRHRIGRGPLAGALFFAVTLAPVLGFVNHDYMEYSFVADRFQYLAGIGVIAVLVGAAWRHAGRLPGRLRWGAAGLAGVALALLGTMTWRQAGIYKDEATFFSHVVSLNPRAWKGHYNLSTALIQDGRPEEALAAARIAVQNRPDNADTHTILGVALVRAERFVEAEEILRRALAVDPGHRNGRRFMAETLMKQGRYEEALEAYRAVLEVAPNYPLAYAFVGQILVRLQRYDDAVEPLSKALTLVKAAPSLTPDLPTAESLHVLLGKTLQGTGRAGAGEAHFRQALQLDPHNLEALEYVAASDFRRKRYRQALELYRRQLEIDSDKATTHANIGAALHFLGRTEEAIRSLERALALDPTLETARENLAAMQKLAK